MKTLKILITVVLALGGLILLYLGLRLLPGLLFFVMARDLALQAGWEACEALAIAFFASAVPFAFLLWQRRAICWRNVGLIMVLAPMVLAAYFAGISILRDRAGVVSNPARWFGADGRPLLFYVRDSDGSYIFCNRSGYHYRTGQQLKPVTPEIYREWQQLKGRHDAQVERETLLKADLARKISEAERTKGELEARLTTAEALARENAINNAGLVRQKLEVENAKREMEARLNATESNMQRIAALQQETSERMGRAEQTKRELENQLQFSAAKLIESARLAEDLAQRKAQAEKEKKELENQLQSSTVKLIESARLAEDLAQRKTQAESEKKVEEPSRQDPESEHARREARVSQKPAARTVENVGGVGGLGQKSKEAGMRAPVSGVSSKGAISVVTIPIANQTGWTVYVTFSSDRYQHAWPRPGHTFVIGPGQAVLFSLQGYSGELVYYTAWAAENPAVQWGKCACMTEAESTPIAIFGTAGPTGATLVAYR